MKQTIKLTEEDISRIVMEAIEEINARPQSRFAKFTGYNPGFNAENDRHMKGYDTIKDSVMFVMNKYKLRPDVVSGILSTIEDDIKLGQY